MQQQVGHPGNDGDLDLLLYVQARMSSPPISDAALAHGFRTWTSRDKTAHLVGRVSGLVGFVHAAGCLHIHFIKSGKSSSLLQGWRIFGI